MRERAVAEWAAGSPPMPGVLFDAGVPAGARAAPAVAAAGITCAWERSRSGAGAPCALP